MQVEGGHWWKGGEQRWQRRDRRECGLPGIGPSGEGGGEGVWRQDLLEAVLKDLKGEMCKVYSRITC